MKGYVRKDTLTQEDRILAGVISLKSMVFKTSRWDGKYDYETFVDKFGLREKLTCPKCGRLRYLAEFDAYNVMKCFGCWSNWKHKIRQNARRRRARETGRPYPRRYRHIFTDINKVRRIIGG